MSITHAMVLAAGRGERMRPLTDQVPKPLLEVQGRPLIVHHLEKLARVGVREVVINLSWLGDALRTALGDGARWGLRIHYSEEGPVALETGGGIQRALPWLGDGPFLVVNGDVFTSFDFAALQDRQRLVQLLLVPNPPQHPHGDFTLAGERIVDGPGARFTYAGIGLYRPALFDGTTAGRFALLPLLQRALRDGQLGGQVFEGRWCDVGTPERLAALRAEVH